MPRTKRSKRLCIKLQDKYKEYFKKTISSIQTKLNKHNYIICKNDRSKNIYDVYKLINLNIDMFKKTYSPQIFEHIIKKYYYHSFNYHKELLKIIEKPSKLKKIFKEINSIRSFYEKTCIEKFYFLKYKLNNNLIYLIDMYL
jgi:hypothetical protein